MNCRQNIVNTIRISSAVLEHSLCGRVVLMVPAEVREKREALGVERKRSLHQMEMDEPVRLVIQLLFQMCGDTTYAVASAPPIR